MSLTSIEHSINGYHIEIKAGKEIKLANPTLVSFIKNIDLLNTVVPLSEFNLEKEEGNNYYYRWLTEDGRSWVQILRIEQETTYMTFDVSEHEFRLNEFTPHRNLRLDSITLIREYSVNEVKVTFT